MNTSTCRSHQELVNIISRLSNSFYFPFYTNILMVEIFFTQVVFQFFKKTFEILFEKKTPRKLFIWVYDGAFMLQNFSRSFIDGIVFVFKQILSFQTFPKTFGIHQNSQFWKWEFMSRVLGMFWFESLVLSPLIQWMFHSQHFLNLPLTHFLHFVLT